MGKDRHRGWVYAIAAPDVSDGRVKIGHTLNAPKDRMAELQTGSPVVLKLMGAVPGSRAVEGMVHQLFASRRLHGEWFDFTGEDPVAIIRAAVALIDEAVADALSADADSKLQMPGESTDARTERILSFSAENPGLSTRKLAAALKAPQSAVQRALAADRATKIRSMAAGNPNLSQTELARHFGVNQSTVSRALKA